MSDGSSRENSTKAVFAETLQPRIGGNTTKVVLRGLANKSANTANDSNEIKDENDGDENDEELDVNVLNNSPLLSSTPPTISKALVKLYPYLILYDKFLSIITWSGEDIWPSLLTVFIYITVVLYLPQLTRYFGHIIIVSLLLGYSKLNKFIEMNIFSNPTLEDIVNIMDRVSFKSDLLLSPLTNLSLQNVERLLFTVIILSPFHILFSLLVFPPKKFLLFIGVFLLTYHSSWSKVTRRLLWKFKSVRLMIFYITGLNLGGINNRQDKGIFATVQKHVNKLTLHNDYYYKDNSHDSDNVGNNTTINDIRNDNGKNGDISNETGGKPIKFTYVLYENQRHWIGIGWKSNMLSYERTPWTDEFLNEAPSPEDFKLPQENDNNGNSNMIKMKWRWLDKSWRLDLTNDGAISIPNSKVKTTADPTPDQGYIYYDNSWKKPSSEESFSKYTRRRRWVRTAELIRVEDTDRQDVSNKRDSRSSETGSSNGIDDNNKGDLAAVTDGSVDDHDKLTRIENNKGKDDNDYVSDGNLTSVRNRSSKK